MLIKHKKQLPYRMVVILLVTIGLSFNAISIFNNTDLMVTVDNSVPEIREFDTNWKVMGYDIPIEAGKTFKEKLTADLVQMFNVSQNVTEFYLLLPSDNASEYLLPIFSELEVYIRKEFSMTLIPDNLTKLVSADFFGDYGLPLWGYQCITFEPYNFTNSPPKIDLWLEGEFRADANESESLWIEFAATFIPYDE